MPSSSDESARSPTGPPPPVEEVRSEEERRAEHRSAARRLFTGPPPPVSVVQKTEAAQETPPPSKEEAKRSVPPPLPRLPVSAQIARIAKEPDRYTGPPPPAHPVSAQIARITTEEVTNLTGPPPPVRAIERATEVEEAPKPRDAQATKPPPPPPRRQTMEVQMAWLDAPADEPRVEQVPTPNAGEAKSSTPTPVAPPVDAYANEFPDDEAPTALRRKPPRIPGSMRTLPPMPLSNVPTKPPPPPARRQTQEVEMAWVELVDDDLVEEPSSGSLPSVDVSLSSGALPSTPESRAELPKLYDEAEPREITRVESAPVSTQRLEIEKAAVAAEAGDRTEGPPISDTLREARAQEALATAKRPALDDETLAEAKRKERLSQFLQATSASIVPGALPVSELRDREPTSDAELDKMREDALAARKRDQDARDREIRERRRAARERERLEDEAKLARIALEKKEAEERAAALRQGTQNEKLLDLSGIDDEIDNALDAILGPNLSYPPPPPVEPKDDGEADD